MASKEELENDKKEVEQKIDLHKKDLKSYERREDSGMVKFYRELLEKDKTELKNINREISKLKKGKAKEEEEIKEDIKSEKKSKIEPVDIKKKIGKSKVGTILGKGIFGVGKGIAKAGGFIAGTAAGAGTALAGKGASKLKEHVWSHNQFDKLIWLGALYYIIQWYFYLGLGIDVFGEVPYQLLLINIILAVLILLFFFQPSLKSFIGGVIIIFFYTLMMEGYYRIKLPIAVGGDLGLIISLLAVTLLFGLIWHHILQVDVSGMFGVAIVFLLETGFKFFIASQIIPLNNSLGSLLLYLPYWIILGVVAGSYTEEGSSKLVGFVRFGLVAVILVLVLGNLFTDIAYGSTKFQISESQKEASTNALKESTKKGFDMITKQLKIVACYIDVDVQKCISEVTAPTKKELTEEEKTMAIPNLKKPPELNIYFSNVNQPLSKEEAEKYENVRITTELRGTSTINKDINLACDIDEKGGSIMYPIIGDKEKIAKTITEKDNLNWYSEIVCKPNSKLRSGENDAVFLAKVRQKPDTSYINYFIDEDKLNALTKKYKTADDTENEKKCQYTEESEKCREQLRGILYSRIPELDGIKTDYSDLSKILSKYDSEYASILIKNIDPLIGVPKEGEKKFNIRFWIANNNENGEIVKIYDVFIEIPEPITLSNCKILEGENGKYKIKKEILDSITLNKIKKPKEQKLIPGICELKVKGMEIDGLVRILIKGTIDYDYQLKNKFYFMVS